MIFILLFILLGLTYSVEACTSIVRKAGYFSGEPIAGSSLQSSLSIIARVVSFAFIPLVGFAADTGYLERNNFLIVFAPLFILVSLIPVRLFVDKLFRFSFLTARSVATRGKLFFSASAFDSLDLKDVEISYTKLKTAAKRKRLSHLPAFRFYLMLSYVPYYLSWPIAMLLISKFPEYRATLASSTTILTAFNTLYFTLIADPALVRIGSKRLTIQTFYFLAVEDRIFAATLSTFLFALTFFLF